MTNELPVSRFRADPGKCTACGLCVADCPARIIELENSVARVAPANDADCIGCQHCLAICPTAAVTVVGKNPADSRRVERADPVALERAILGRRSVRQFAAGNVAPETFRRVVDIVAHAPTGVNMRELRLSVVLDRDVMDGLRRRVCEALAGLGDRVDEEQRWIVDLARDWLNGGADGIFRDAPHVVVASAGPGQVCKIPDCLIALSYFDLYASVNGIGTTWCGMFDAVLRLVPESRKWMGIPDDHEIGYAMLFGPAGVRYARSAQHDPADVNVVERLG